MYKKELFIEHKNILIKRCNGGRNDNLYSPETQQVAPLSQRDRAAGWVSFGQK